MPQLEQMRLGQRIALALIIIGLVLLLTALIEYLRSDPVEAEPLPPVIVSKYAERLDMLDLEAIQAAYKDQIGRLFENWMRDPHGQPERAIKGAYQARSAYIAAMNTIETRQQQRRDAQEKR